jgi:hypothetical protein
MRSHRTSLALAAVALLIAVAPERLPEAATDAPAATQPGPGLGPVRIKEQLLNQQVKNDKGENLGLIDEALVDSQGRLLYVALAPSGEMGLANRYVLVPWPALSRSTDDNLSLPLTKEQLAQAPAYDKNRPPDLDNVDFNTAAYGFYGLGYTVPATEFGQLDLNDDGGISAGEAEQYPLLSAHFAAADRNRNGNVDAAEFSAFEQRTKLGGGKRTR